MAYGTLKSDVVQSSTAGTPPQFNDGNGTQVGTLCRAWVNYKGTSTQSIRGSFNVSSVTYNGTGNYTINFTTALPDVNYCANSTVERAGSFAWFPCVTAMTTTTLQIIVTDVSATAQNADAAFVAIFR